MTISIKMEPELRHALAHLIYAVDALAKGDLAEAQYEIESIKGLVFWDSDAGQTVDAREWLARQTSAEENDHGQEGRQEVQPKDVQDLSREGRQGLGGEALGVGEELQGQEVGPSTET